MSENSAEKATTDTATPKAPRAMRRANREVTDPADLVGIIGRAHVPHVSFSDAEGLAVAPVNYGFVWAKGQGLPAFWLHSAGEGRKADAWASSPEVALELDVEGGVITGDYSCVYSYAYESVMTWGAHPVRHRCDREAVRADAGHGPHGPGRPGHVLGRDGGTRGRVTHRRRADLGQAARGEGAEGAGRRGYCRQGRGRAGFERHECRRRGRGRVGREHRARDHSLPHPGRRRAQAQEG